MAWDILLILVVDISDPASHWTVIYFAWGLTTRWANIPVVGLRLHYI